MSDCTKCRRENKKLFLKGDRCFSTKCALVRRAYPPGQGGADRRIRLSEYGKQLRMKQSLKRNYGLGEKQFKSLFLQAESMEGDTGNNLLTLLESRLDNVVYRLSLAESRSQARQLVSHGHLLINGRKVTVPSYRIKPEDQVAFSKKFIDKEFIKDRLKVISKKLDSNWLVWDAKDSSGKIISAPDIDQLKKEFNPKLVIEFYSK